MDKYLFWEGEIIIESINENMLFLYVKKGGKINRNIINETAKEIIFAIDGTYTLQMIIQSFAQKYNESQKSISKKIIPFLEILQEEYEITLLESDYPQKNPVTIRYANMYPRVVSLEITNRCNIKCLHCYGNFDNTNEEFMPLERVKKLLDDLNDIGVFIIELTGGECLTHPNFKEILSYALSLDFVRISILTNGIALTDTIMDLIIQNKNRIYVQIDLHSLRDSYLSWFTGACNTLNIIQRNIRYLADAGLTMRVATIITKRNITEMQEIAKWVFDMGIRQYAPSLVIKLGRANFSNTDILLDSEEFIEMFNDNVKMINIKFDGIIKLNENNGFQGANCGCLTSHVAIDTYGRIKICTMDTLECISTNWGNVFEKRIQEIYDDNQKQFISFSRIPVPKADSKECVGCPKRVFCSSCLLRAFISVKELKDKCKWYQQILTEDMKETLFG
ncbi:MAG: PqqD family peptide modification chaperone [Hespellia sp.]|nr:PqqD family peptide modification chaperone [Hespellia sp.]